MTQTDHAADRPTVIEAVFPPKLIGPLFEPARFKVLYGGRGGAKSWSIARALLIRGAQGPLRVLCAREFMSSINDSVWKLLCDQIVDLGLTSVYTIERAQIYSANGTIFSFSGIRNNIQAIRSYEGVDVCWVEEAENVTKSSWDVLIPTIRKERSEIILSFNPDSEESETYKRFVLNPPPDSIVVKVNYNDNPFFPDVLRREMTYCREHDPDAFANIWEGFPRQYLDHAVYAKELRLAQSEGRICKVPYDPAHKVDTFWDLGWRDSTSIVMAQVVAMEYRIIDFLQANQQPIQWYLKQLQAKPYVYGMDYLPHDAKAKQLGSGRSIEEILRQSGRKVSIVPKLTVNDGIAAARTIFPNLYIDDKKCDELIKALRKYRYEMSTSTTRPVPVHDASSHAADSLRYAAISLRAPKAALTSTPRPHRRDPMGGQEAGAWMV